MPLDPEILDLLALGGAGLGLLALVVAVAAHVRLGRLRRAYDLLQGDGTGDDFVTAVARQIDAVEALRADVQTARLRPPTPAGRSTRRSGTSRWSATTRSATWAGGCRSRSRWSTTTVTGWSSPRSPGAATPAPTPRALRGGRSDQALSPEEEEAIGFALETTPGMPRSADLDPR